MSDVSHKIVALESTTKCHGNYRTNQQIRSPAMLALAMPVMGFVPTIVPRSAPVRMQVGRTRA